MNQSWTEMAISSFIEITRRCLIFCQFKAQSGRCLIKRKKLSFKCHIEIRKKLKNNFNLKKNNFNFKNYEI